MCILKNSLNQSHDFIKSIVKEGDTVIDCTAGNGNDTVFLAGLVGERGRVYSFDIQKRAITKAREKLEARGLLQRVELVNDGHENLDAYVTAGVKSVMFNLGYLPGGDHDIGTKSETTIEALKKSMELLVPKGLISIVVYYGGDSGFDEKEKVLDFIKTVDCRKFSVMKTEFVNQINCPPILVLIEKFDL